MTPRREPPTAEEMRAAREELCEATAAMVNDHAVVERYSRDEYDDWRDARWRVWRARWRLWRTARRYLRYFEERDSRNV